MRYTNSSFRTRQERDCVQEIIRDGGLALLQETLVAVGLDAESAAEFCDDPNALPTSVRRLVVARRSK